MRLPSVIVLMLMIVLCVPGSLAAAEKRRKKRAPQQADSAGATAPPEAGATRGRNAAGGTRAVHQRARRPRPRHSARGLRRHLRVLRVNVGRRASRAQPGARGRRPDDPGPPVLGMAHGGDAPLVRSIQNGRLFCCFFTQNVHRGPCLSEKKSWLFATLTGCSRSRRRLVFPTTRNAKRSPAPPRSARPWAARSSQLSRAPYPIFSFFF